MAKKKKQKGIFDGIRKATPPPSKKFKTRKKELERKKKHKGQEDENSG